MANGKIVSTGSQYNGTSPKIYDATGKWVLPGVIDGQTHLSSQKDREGVGLGTRGAAAGGVTTVVDMPYDAHAPVHNLATFKEKVNEIEQDAHIDVALYATIAKVDGMAEIQPMIDAGACAFKVSQYETDPNRFARIPPYDMLQLFSTVAPSGLSCGVHNENQEVVDHEIARINQTNNNHYTGYGLSRPPISETLAQVYQDSPVFSLILPFSVGVIVVTH